MKTKRFVAIYIYIVTAVALLCLPASVNATAIFNAKVEFAWNSEGAFRWQYRVTNSNPGNADSCLSDGSPIPGSAAGGGGFLAKFIQVVSLGPPFSGSSSRTRYITTCRENDQYAIVEMTIHLNRCALWMCSGQWDFTVIKKIGADADRPDDLSRQFDIGKKTIWPDNITIGVPLFRPGE